MLYIYYYVVYKLNHLKFLNFVKCSAHLLSSIPHHSRLAALNLQGINNAAISVCVPEERVRFLCMAADMRATEAASRRRIESGLHCGNFTL